MLLIVLLFFDLLQSLRLLSSKNAYTRRGVNVNLRSTRFRKPRIIAWRISGVTIQSSYSDMVKHYMCQSNPFRLQQSSYVSYLG